VAVRIERLPRIVLVLPAKLRTIRGFLCLPSGTKPGTKPFLFPRQKWLKPWCVSIGRKNREIESISLQRRVMGELGSATSSRRPVEELLAGRALDISYETEGRWVLKFRPLDRSEPEHRRGRSQSGPWCANGADTPTPSSSTTDGFEHVSLTGRRGERAARSLGRAKEPWARKAGLNDCSTPITSCSSGMDRSESTIRNRA